MGWYSLNDDGIGGALEQRDVKLRQLSELDEQQPQHPPKDRRSIFKKFNPGLFNSNLQQHHVQPVETSVKQPMQQQQLQQQQQPSTTTAGIAAEGCCCCCSCCCICS